MKVYTLRANENWFCDRFFKEWEQHAKEYCTPFMEDCDVIWLLPSWQWRRIPQRYLESKKVVASVHHIVPEKFNKNDFMARDRFVDCYHVPCQQTKDNINAYTSKPIKVVGYWLNSEVWSPISVRESRGSLGLNHEDYIVGSFQRDTEGSDLITPKLEKGPDLFVEYLKKIKKPNLHVLLGGWRRQYVISRLEEEGINYTYIELASLETLKKMYASLDLYLVSSRYEGGPQALLEAPAMYVPIISTDVGMASDILSKKCIIDVTKETYTPSNHDVVESYDGAHKFEIKKHIKNYVKLFEEVV
jgi:glycosyltransferase involved in cell wall biosynthesis